MDTTEKFRRYLKKNKYRVQAENLSSLAESSPRPSLIQQSPLASVASITPRHTTPLATITPQPSTTLQPQAPVQIPQQPIQEAKTRQYVEVSKKIVRIRHIFLVYIPQGDGKRCDRNEQRASAFLRFSKVTFRHKL